MDRLRGIIRSLWSFVRRWAPRVLRAFLAISLLLLGFMSLVGIVVLQRQGDIPPVGPALGRIAGLALSVLLLASLWWVPRRQARAVADALPAPERAALEDRFRRTFAAVTGGVVLVILVGKMAGVHADSQAADAGDQLMQAAAALGSEHAVSRVAAVHTLGALAESSERMRRPAYETLQAFVRARVDAVPPVDATAPAADTITPPADVVAAVTLLSRRRSDGDGAPFRPDLRGANLHGARLAGAQWDFSDLRGAHLEGADLRGARVAGTGGADLRGIRLDGADLSDAHLDGADLGDGAVLAGAVMRRTDLDGATLRGADLRRARLDSAELAGATLTLARLDSASLIGADLSGATLRGATLEGADLAGAVLDNAHLPGTDLSRVRNLTASQLVKARWDSTTVLPLALRSLPLPPPRPR